MTSRPWVAIAGAALWVVGAACAPSSAPSSPSALPSPGSRPAAPALGVTGIRPPAQLDLPVTVRSADGRNVRVRSAARIVSLWGGLSEIVFELGLGTRLVGRDVATTFAEAGRVPVVTRAHDVSAEAVLSQRPTVVLAQSDTGPPEALAQIRRAGVPVVVFDVPSSITAMLDRIRAVGTALGAPGQAAALAERVAARIAAVQARIPPGVPRPLVAFLYLRGGAGVYLIGGPGSGADTIIEAAGGRDAGTAMGLRRAFTPLTSEALVRAAPDVLLVTDSGLRSVGGRRGLLELPGVAQTPAGRAGRVLSEEDGRLYGFAMRTPEVIERLLTGVYGREVR